MLVHPGSLGGWFTTISGLAGEWRAALEYYETVGEHFGLIDPDAWRVGVEYIHTGKPSLSEVYSRTNAIYDIVQAL